MNPRNMTDEELFRELEELDDEVGLELAARYYPDSSEIGDAYQRGWDDGKEEIIKRPHAYNVEFHESYIEERSYREGYTAGIEEHYNGPTVNDYLDREFDL